MLASFQLYVGIDWAKDDYQVCAIDPDAAIVSRRKVLHDGKAMQDFADWLAALSDAGPAATAIAIEMPRGAIVELLLERGFAVFSINPKQMERFRDRHSAGGVKDDPLDAFVAADSLRTDLKLFHQLRLDDPDTIRLRELSRTDDEVRQELNRALNQVREQLHRYYPQLLSLCPSAEDAWLWDLWQIVPLPAQGARISTSRLEKLLKRHRIRKIKATDAIEKLRSKALPVAPGVAEAAAEHIAVLLPRLRLLSKQRDDLRLRMAQILEALSRPASSEQPSQSSDPTPDSQPQEHRDAAILLSLPGIGTTIGATMLAEASQALRDRDYHALRGYSGTAPITKKSGRKRSVLMRRACNTRLRNAIHHWAFVSLTLDERSFTHYRQLRAAGHTHGRALRGVADRWLNVLVAMLRNGTLFDATRWQPTHLPLS